MRTLICFVFACLILFVSTAHAQVTDTVRSVQINNNADSTSTTLVQVQQNNNDDEFSIFLIVLGLAAIASTFVCMGIGVIIIFLALLAFFAMISIGIISTSAFVGFYKKSLSQGFKTFIVLSASLLGMCVVTPSFILLNKLFHWTAMKSALITGMIAGLAGGVLLGFGMIVVLRKLALFFKSRYKFD